MTDIKQLEESIVWIKGCDLVLEIYKLTKKFPREERFSITSQMQRAAISIPSNIAEGLLRRTKKELAYFINIAKGSAGELITQLMIAKRLGYIDTNDIGNLKKDIIEIIKITKAIINTIRKHNHS